MYWRKLKKRLCCPIWRTEEGIMANSATALKSPRFLVSLWNCCYVGGGDPNRPIFMKWWIFPKRSSSFRNGSCKHKQYEVFAGRGKLRFLYSTLNLKRMLLADLSLSPELSKLKKNPCRESIIIFGNQKKVWKYGIECSTSYINWIENPNIVVSY